MGGQCGIGKNARLPGQGNEKPEQRHAGARITEYGGQFGKHEQDGKTQHDLFRTDAAGGEAIGDEPVDQGAGKKADGHEREHLRRFARAQAGDIREPGAGPEGLNGNLRAGREGGQWRQPPENGRCQHAHKARE